MQLVADVIRHVHNTTNNSFLKAAAMIVIDRHKLPLDEKQQKAVEEMKGKFPDMKDESRIKRFLRARNYDIPLSSELLANDIKWRAEFKPETLAPDQFPDQIALGKGYMHFCDLDSRPLAVFLAAKHFQSDKTEETYRFAVWFLEEMIRNMPEGVETFTVLCDFDGWGMANVDMGLTKMALATLQNYYPERLGRVLLLSPPFIFRTVWTLIKPLMNEVTRNKIIFLSDPKELVQYIAPENIPAKYGGKSEFVFIPGPVSVGIIKRASAQQ